MMMMKSAKKLAGALAMLSLSGCALFGFGNKQAPPQPLKNVIFRLTEVQDAVEVRLEADYYPSHNWDIVADADGQVEPTSGVTVTVEGVREPIEPHGSAAPASGRLILKRDSDAKPGAWPLVFKMLVKGEGEKLDKYTVEHVPGAWKVTPEQGTFTRYERHGSF